MSKPAIKRVWSAFRTYRLCVRRKEDAREHRQYYAGKGIGSIAIDHDRYARKWQKWDRRAKIVYEWFRIHFSKREDET